MRGGGAREPLLGGGGAPRGGAGFRFGEYAEEDALAADGAAPGLSAPTEARDGESEGESDREGGHSRGRRVLIDDELGVAEDGWPTPGWAGAGALARTPTSQALEDKLAMAYAERQRMREEWRRADPDLRHFPLLQIMLRCVGLLPLRGRGRASQRLVAALFYALQLAPYVPMLVLRRCEADEKPGATCSSFTTWDAYRMVDDAVLLGAVLYWLGSDLVVTLHHAELMGSPGVRRARQRMAKGWAVTLWLVYAVFWMALPIAELLRSTLPRPISSYDLPLGDLAVRVLWVVAGPPRACFMAGLMTSLTLVLSSARPDLKAIRAAAAVLGNRRPGSELSTEAALGQVGMLVRRYSQLAMALTQASDRVQALMAFLLAFACNVLLQACLMWTMRIDMSSDHRDEWAHYTGIVHNLTFAALSLAVFGIAAHVTALCDKTLRALQHAGGLHLGAYVARCAEGGGGVLDPALLSAAQVMQQALAGVADGGGFRIAGQRIAFSLFVVLVTLAVAASNIMSVLHVSADGP